MEQVNPIDAEKSGHERQEVSLRFEGQGFDLFGWGVLWVLTMIALAFPEAWLRRSMFRWLLRNTKAADGSIFSFNGVPKEIWFWFPIQGIISFTSGRVEVVTVTWLLGIAYGIVGLYVTWRVMKWYVGGLVVRDKHTFRFTGNLMPYVGWQILSILSLATVVGWAWVDVAWQKWNYRHMECRDADLHFHGAPTKLLGLGLLYIGIPGVIVFLTWLLWRVAFYPVLIPACLILPWLMLPILRWYVQNTTLSLPVIDVLPETAETAAK
jgi:uncharacterized membrane protein YjgN (DUF898 family)